MPTFEFADRVKHLPPYLFAAIDAMKQEALSRGVDLIDLSIGDPDLPTPKHIVEAMKEAVEKPAHHRYPSYEGMPAFREAVAGWYKTRFNVALDPRTEVLSLIGSKEGIGHIPLAFVNPGDVALVPSPGYPVYPVATLFAGGESHLMPLLEENGFLPDFRAIPESVLKKASLMFINYPNNPTSAVTSRSFYEDVIELARKYHIIVCHDAAYSEIYYDGRRPMSFMEVDGSAEVGIEFHSLSKTYNMTGWRIGFAVGNSRVLAGLGKIKTNLDSGVFEAIQEAAIVAFGTGEEVLSGIRGVYQARRDALYNGLRGLGLHVIKPEATFYLWTKVPPPFDSSGFVAHILETSGVLATPGNGFGSPGEGYVRFALTVPVERIKEAVERIKKALREGFRKNGNASLNLKP
ncbi:MAG: LL-diaminopimelate aminotransferase [Nitrospirae bacterium]|nr:LL-diaminopimelate aminotransferase [Nitrospirota bacterium]